MFQMQILCTFMAARRVVFEPSTVCACAQVLWQQRTPPRKYFHPPASDAEIYIPKIRTLWCKLESHFGFLGTRRCFPKRTTVVLQASHRSSFFYGTKLTEKPECPPYPPSHSLDLPVICCKTAYCSLCKRGNGGLKRSKSCYFVIAGSPSPPKKKSFVNVFPSRPLWIMLLRF